MIDTGNIAKEADNVLFRDTVPVVDEAARNNIDTLSSSGFLSDPGFNSPVHSSGIDHNHSDLIF